ncbi:hypothetical protein B0T13DRAFT_309318 [Neurospora crassa]|nr:hypothetical protein B0T13DRAFT_309318 [Neurospora crassa]
MTLAPALSLTQFPQFPNLRCISGLSDRPISLLFPPSLFCSCSPHLIRSEALTRSWFGSQPQLPFSYLPLSSLPHIPLSDSVTHPMVLGADNLGIKQPPSRYRQTLGPTPGCMSAGVPGAVFKGKETKSNSPIAFVPLSRAVAAAAAAKRRNGNLHTFPSVRGRSVIRVHYLAWLWWLLRLLSIVTPAPPPLQKRNQSNQETPKRQVRVSVATIRKQHHLAQRVPLPLLTHTHIAPQVPVPVPVPALTLRYGTLPEIHTHIHTQRSVGGISDGHGPPKKRLNPRPNDIVSESTITQTGHRRNSLKRESTESVFSQRHRHTNTSRLILGFCQNLAFFLVGFL